MRVLPLGTAYTVWTGIGAVGAFVAGKVLDGPVQPARLFEETDEARLLVQRQHAPYALRRARDKRDRSCGFGGGGSLVRHAKDGSRTRWGWC